MALFDIGRKVGKLARERYPGGILIRQDHLHHDDGVRATRTAMENPQTLAVFEGAFTFEDIRIRTDILERRGIEPWNLIEVKSGTTVKGEHVYDVAIQYYVLKGLGVDIGRVGLLTLNKDYVYDGQRLDLGALFTLTDLKQEVLEIQNEITGEVGELKNMLAQETRPEISPSRHCLRPYACEFFDHCRRDMPEHWTLELLGIRQDRLDELAIKGILDIRDIPESFPLSALQARIKHCVIHNTEYIGADLGVILRQYEYPIHFLDFEAVAPPIPRFPNTRPYEMMPFQWSDHVLSEDGTLTHESYLAGEDKDPREGVARTLLESLGTEGSICTYTVFERQVIAELADRLPQLRQRLEALTHRFRDLYDEVRKNYYHPEFHGSFSIKKVLPVLVPAMSYADLSIQEGGQAGLEYLRMIGPDTSSEERQRIRRGLLDYCRQDTLAMVKIREELLKRCG
jgi:predicted RecB family nuclease